MRLPKETDIALGGRLADLRQCDLATVISRTPRWVRNQDWLESLRNPHGLYPVAPAVKKFVVYRESVASHGLPKLKADLIRAKIRRINAEADLLDLRNDLTRGDTVSKSAVTEAMSRIVRSACDHLGRLSEQIAPQLPADLRAGLVEAIDRYVDASLRSIREDLQDVSEGRS